MIAYYWHYEALCILHILGINFNISSLFRWLSNDRSVENYFGKHCFSWSKFDYEQLDKILKVPIIGCFTLSMFIAFLRMSSLATYLYVSMLVAYLRVSSLCYLHVSASLRVSMVVAYLRLSNWVHSSYFFIHFFIEYSIRSLFFFVEPFIRSLISS